MLVDLDVLARLDAYIQRESTGDAQALAQKMSLRRRHLFRYLEFLRDDCSLQISFCSVRQTYYYADSKEFVFRLGKK